MKKAELIEDYKGKTIHTVRKAYKWPSVIRLNSYIKVPFRKIILSRKNILKRDGHKCVYCGRGDLPLTLDHVLPRSRGGTDDWENLVAACLPCNNKKGDRTPEEANLTLRTIPYKPNHVMYMKNSVNRLEDSWKPYLFHS